MKVSDISNVFDEYAVLCIEYAQIYTILCINHGESKRIKLHVVMMAVNYVITQCERHCGRARREHRIV